ncbi:hypothetical protein KBTX_01194 [wastewater metagenome]|uniref:Uncharacterized protein n=2 Tax=unclassified sequences TaxID=12908 RepID=A0A5B8RDR9_9ZZZZ|nr:hypothetical protein KBTEX_01194 [uncultured organism]
MGGALDHVGVHRPRDPGPAATRGGEDVVHVEHVAARAHGDVRAGGRRAVGGRVDRGVLDLRAGRAGHHVDVAHRRAGAGAGQPRDRGRDRGTEHAHLLDAARAHRQAVDVLLVLGEVVHRTEVLRVGPGPRIRRIPGDGAVGDGDVVAGVPAQGGHPRGAAGDGRRGLALHEVEGRRTGDPGAAAEAGGAAEHAHDAAVAGGDREVVGRHDVRALLDPRPGRRSDDVGRHRAGDTGLAGGGAAHRHGLDLRPGKRVHADVVAAVGTVAGFATDIRADGRADPVDPGGHTHARRSAATHLPRQRLDGRGVGGAHGGVLAVVAGGRILDARLDGAVKNVGGIGAGDTHRSRERAGDAGGTDGPVLAREHVHAVADVEHAPGEQGAAAALDGVDRHPGAHGRAAGGVRRSRQGVDLRGPVVRGHRQAAGGDVGIVRLRGLGAQHRIDRQRAADGRRAGGTAGDGRGDQARRAVLVAAGGDVDVAGADVRRATRERRGATALDGVDRPRKAYCGITARRERAGQAPDAAPAARRDLEAAGVDRAATDTGLLLAQQGVDGQRPGHRDVAGRATGDRTGTHVRVRLAGHLDVAVRGDVAVVDGDGLIPVDGVHGERTADRRGTGPADLSGEGPDAGERVTAVGGVHAQARGVDIAALIDRGAGGAHQVAGHQGATHGGVARGAAGDCQGPHRRASAGVHGDRPRRLIRGRGGRRDIGSAYPRRHVTADAVVAEGGTNGDLAGGGEAADEGIQLAVGGRVHVHPGGVDHRAVLVGGEAVALGPHPRGDVRADDVGDRRAGEARLVAGGGADGHAEYRRVVGGADVDVTAGGDVRVADHGGVGAVHVGEAEREPAGRSVGAALGADRGTEDHLPGEIAVEHRGGAVVVVGLDLLLQPAVAGEPGGAGEPRAAVPRCGEIPGQRREPVDALRVDGHVAVGIDAGTAAVALVDLRGKGVVDIGAVERATDRHPAASAGGERAEQDLAGREPEHVDVVEPGERAPADTGGGVVADPRRGGGSAEPAALLAGGGEERAAAVQDARTVEGHRRDVRRGAVSVRVHGGDVAAIDGGSGAPVHQAEGCRTGDGHGGAARAAATHRETQAHRHLVAGIGRLHVHGAGAIRRGVDHPRAGVVLEPVDRGRAGDRRGELRAVAAHAQRAGPRRTDEIGVVDRAQGDVRVAAIVRRVHGDVGDLGRGIDAGTVEDPRAGQGQAEFAVAALLAAVAAGQGLLAVVAAGALLQAGTGVAERAPGAVAVAAVVLRIAHPPLGAALRRAAGVIGVTALGAGHALLLRVLLPGDRRGHPEPDHATGRVRRDHEIARGQHAATVGQRQATGVQRGRQKVVATTADIPDRRAGIRLDVVDEHARAHAGIAGEGHRAGETVGLQGLVRIDADAPGIDRGAVGDDGIGIVVHLGETEHAGDTDARALARRRQDLDDEVVRVGVHAQAVAARVDDRFVGDAGAGGRIQVDPGERTADTDRARGAAATGRGAAGELVEHTGPGDHPGMRQGAHVDGLVVLPVGAVRTGHERRGPGIRGAVPVAAGGDAGTVTDPRLRGVVDAEIVDRTGEPEGAGTLGLGLRERGEQAVTQIEHAGRRRGRLLEAADHVRRGVPVFRAGPGIRIVHGDRRSRLRAHPHGVRGDGGVVADERPRVLGVTGDREAGADRGQRTAGAGALHRQGVAGNGTDRLLLGPGLDRDAAVGIHGGAILDTRIGAHVGEADGHGGTELDLAAGGAAGLLVEPAGDAAADTAGRPGAATA